MGHGFRGLGDSPLDVWRAEKRMYDALAEDGWRRATMSGSFHSGIFAGVLTNA